VIHVLIVINSQLTVCILFGNMYGLLQKTGPNLSWWDAKAKCKEDGNKKNTNFTLELVYGCAGNLLRALCKISTMDSCGMWD